MDSTKLKVPAEPQQPSYEIFNSVEALNYASSLVQRQDISIVPSSTDLATGPKADIHSKRPNESSLSNTRDFDHNDHDYHRALKLMPSLVQILRSHRLSSSSDHQGTTMNINSYLKTAGINIGNSLNACCEDFPPGYKEWDYHLASSTQTARQQSYQRKLKYKVLRMVSEETLFGPRSDCKTVELNNAIDSEAQSQNSLDNLPSLDITSKLLGCPACKPQNEILEPTTLYHSLPDKSFRLLVLRPGRITEPICTQLRCAKLTEMVSLYEALSYSWHEEVDVAAKIPRVINCNGIEIPVQPNLAAALQRLRSETTARVFWIDALCINQSNIEERSQQVQLMSLIYKNAARTVVWLGETKYGCAGKAFSLICGAINHWYGKDRAFFWRCQENITNEQASNLPIDSPTSRGGISKWKLGSKEFEIEHRPLQTSRAFQMSLLDLFHLSWWTRKWVIQEITLSKSAIAMWQNCEISWYWIGLFAAILETQNENSSPMRVFLQRTLVILDNSLSNAYIMFRLSRWGELSPVGLSFLQLLRLAMSFDTGDPRDAIFALLGLQTSDHLPATKPLILADYRLSMQELNVLLANKFLTLDHPLKFLRSARCLRKSTKEGVETSTSMNSAPLLNLEGSWVPDWARRLEPMLGPLSLDESFTPSEGLRYARQLSKDPMRLTVNGIKVATIIYHEPMQEFLTERHCKKAWRSRFRLSGAFGHLDHATSTLFCRTLTAGKTMKGNPERRSEAVDILVADFANWLFYCSRNSEPNYSWCASIRCQQCYSFLSSASENSSSSFKFRERIEDLTLHRHLFVTSAGHLGLGPEQMESGDVICVLGGADMPFIIRPEKDYYRLVGECYVDDIMNGEAVQSMESGKPHKGLFDADLIISRLYNFDVFPLREREVLYQIKQEILDQLNEEYGVLKEEFIDIR